MFKCTLLLVSLFLTWNIQFPYPLQTLQHHPTGTGINPPLVPSIFFLAIETVLMVLKSMQGLKRMALDSVVILADALGAIFSPHL